MGEQHTDGREVTRLGWDHYGRDRQLMGQRASVERSAAAIAEEHEVARIEPVFHRDPPDCFGHNTSGDGDHAVRHPNHAVSPTVTQRLSDPFLDAALCSFFVEVTATTEKVIGVEPSEN